MCHSQSRRDLVIHGCVTAILFLVLPLTLLAEEQIQPGWTSFRNGLTNRGIATRTLPEKPELLWELKSPDGITSTPVISNGRTYVGTLSGDLLCLDLKTGKEIWKYRTVEKVEKNSFAPGFNAPLAINEFGVFGGDDFGVFHAVDRKTGKKLWTVTTDAEIVGGAMLVDERVVFGSHDGHLYCHHAKTGERIWAAETHGPVNATPVLDGKFTFTTGCDKPIMRVFNIDNGKQAHEVELDGALLIASPAVVDNHLYFGTDGGTLLALDWRKKEFSWAFSIPNREQQIKSSPAVTDEYVIIGSGDKHLHCVNRESGDHKWSFGTRARIDSSPVVVGDRVFFGSADKNLYAVNINDGKEAWKFPTKQSITGSPAVAEGYLVIGTDSTNGRILCFGSKASEK